MQTESVDRALLYSIWAGVFLLLFMPLVVTTDTIFPYIVGKAVYSRIVIAVVFILWAALAFRNQNFRLRPSWIVVLLAVYLSVSLLSAIFGVSTQRSLWSTFERMQGVVDLAHWLAIVVVLASVIRTMTNWTYVLNVNLAVSLLVSLIGLGQRFEAQAIPFYDFLPAQQRIGTSLGNPAFVGTYLMINVIIALGLLVYSYQAQNDATGAAPVRRRRGRRRTRGRSPERERDLLPYLLRSFWVGSVLINVWVITLTGTRGAVIALIVGLAAFAVGYVVFGRQRKLKVAASALVAGMVLLAGFALLFRNTPVVERIASANVLVDRLTDLTPDQDPFKSRLLTLDVGFRGFLDRPIFGWGPENYLSVFGRYYTAGSTSPEVLDQAHNKPLEELVTKGLVGLVSYMAVWVWMFYVLIGRARDRNARHQILILTVLGALAAYFTQNMFLFDTPATMLQLSLLIAMAVNVEGLESVGSTSLSNLAGLHRRAGEWFRPARNSLATWRQSVAFRSMKLSLVGLVASIALASLSIFFSYKAYSSASTILEVNRGVRGIDEVIRTVDRSINFFPPLANYPRLILINNVSSIWGALPDEQKMTLLARAELEAQEATASEPENWRIFMMVAKMYQEIIPRMDGFEQLDTARRYLDRAIMLAPERKEVLIIKQQIEYMEKQRDDAK